MDLSRERDAALRALEEALQLQLEAHRFIDVLLPNAPPYQRQAAYAYAEQQSFRVARALVRFREFDEAHNKAITFHQLATRGV